MYNVHIYTDIEILAFYMRIYKFHIEMNTGWKINHSYI